MSIRFLPWPYDKQVLRCIEKVINSTSSEYNLKELFKKMHKSDPISLNFLGWIDALSLQEGLKCGILPIFCIDLDDTMIDILLFLDFYIVIYIQLTFELISSNEVIFDAV